MVKTVLTCFIVAGIKLHKEAAGFELLNQVTCGFFRPINLEQAGGWVRIILSFSVCHILQLITNYLV